MKITTILFLSLFCITCLEAQVVDTVEIRTQIQNIKTKEDATIFLKKVWDTDQKYRGTQTNDSLDIVNLFKVSFYINRFGYPTAKEFGDLSVMPWHVWSHTANYKLRILAFPIIWEGFRHKEIDEKQLRYKLMSFINCQQDLAYFNKTPLKILFADLNFKPSNQISIQEMHETLNDSRLHHTFTVVTKWQSKDLIKEYTVDDKTIEMTFPGEILEILKDENSALYHRTYTTNKGEPRELEKIDANTYIFKDCAKEKLVIDGNLIQHWSDSGVLYEYKNIEN